MEVCQFCNRWEIDSDLRIAEFNHSYLLLNRDQFFPGYTLLFTKQHVTELFDLSAEVQSGLITEISLVAKALHTVFSADKINYELLGNMVPHIHWHLVPRFKRDKLWPRPIWAETHDELLLTAEEYQNSIRLIQGALK